LNNGTKKLIISNFVSKSFATFKELFVLLFIGFSIDYSEILSLLAITSLITTFSDSSILNPIFFPKWILKGRVQLQFNLLHIFCAVIITFSIFLYNRLLITENASLFTEILSSIVWIPIIVKCLLFSVLLFLEKFKLLGLAIIIASFSNFFVMVVGFNFWGIETYIIALLLSAIISSIFALYHVFNYINFESIGFSFSELKKGIISSITVNNALWFLIILKIIFSIFFTSEMASLNYAIVLSLLFYSIFSKSINSASIKDQIITKTTSFYTIKWYLFFGFMFLIFLCFIYILLPIIHSTFHFDLLKFQNVLVISFILSSSIIFLGFFDLKNQKKISSYENTYSLIYLAVVTSITILLLTIFNK
jgi:hypothetical protein